MWLYTTFLHFQFATVSDVKAFEIILIKVVNESHFVWRGKLFYIIIAVEPFLVKQFSVRLRIYQQNFHLSLEYLSL